MISLYQRAIAHLDQAIFLDFLVAEALYQRGKAYSGLGRHQEAATDYDNAIRRDPQLEEALSLDPRFAIPRVQAGK